MNEWVKDLRGFRLPGLVTVLVVAAGLVFQLLFPGGVPLLSWPMNILCVLFLVFSLVFLGIVLRDNLFVVWLAGIPFGLFLVFALAFLSLIGGVVPQDGSAGGSLADMLGLNQVFSGWAFFFVVAVFLANLGLSVARKMVPFRFSNLQFLLFHAGFWIVLACGFAGSADLQRVIIPVYEGRQSTRGYLPEKDRMVELPFSIYLDDFSVEEYTPQITLYDPRNDRVIPGRTGRFTDIGKGYTVSWPGIQVEVVEYLPYALPDKNGNPVPAGREDGIAYAKIRGVSGGTRFETWLNTGSPVMKPRVVRLGHCYLVMFPGSPRAFRSDVVLTGGSGKRSAMLEVNRPVECEGWKLYQMGYDEKEGRWSRLSLIEAVRDPWLPVVYCGFFMIMAGSVLFFWQGIKQEVHA